MKTNMALTKEPILFMRFPALRGRLPWCSLTCTPTPVRRMETLEKALKLPELWIKCDDCSGRIYGGNKPRKLEFLLGHARERGCKSVVTFGALGSNHALATTLMAKELGMEVVSVLIPEPTSPEILRTLQLLHAQGAKLSLGRSVPTVGLLGAWHLLLLLLRGKRPYLIMPGGSSARGCLGYVNAAFELAAQIKAGVCPQPDVIFVPVGSNGTFAGLLAGCALAGIDCRVIGVRVSDYIPAHTRQIAKLAHRTVRLLSRYLPQPLSLELKAEDIEMDSDFLGRGYAYPTDAARTAMALIKQHEGVCLDEVYSGKAFAALLAYAQRAERQGHRLMFWNTYNSVPLDARLPEKHHYKRLPSAFHRYFEQPLADP